MRIRLLCQQGSKCVCNYYLGIEATMWTCLHGHRSNTWDSLRLRHNQHGYFHNTVQRGKDRHAAFVAVAGNGSPPSSRFSKASLASLFFAFVLSRNLLCRCVLKSDAAKSVHDLPNRTSPNADSGRACLESNILDRAASRTPRFKLAKVCLRSRRLLCLRGLVS